MKTITLLILSALSLAAAPRTWTSTDGRTLQASFIASDGKAAKLARTDGQIISVPLALLSEDDRAFVAKEAAAVGSKENALAALARALPKQKNDALRGWDPTNPECIQLYEKYQRLITGVKLDTLAAILKSAHTQIDRDTAQLTPIAQTKTAPGKPSYKSTMAAQCNLAWLTEEVTKHIAKLEAAAP